MTSDVGFRFVDAVTSDLTFEARGATLGDLFAAASEALLAATVERPEAVRKVVERRVELEDTRLDWLLRRFLSEIVYLQDAERLVLRAQGRGARRRAEIRLEATSTASRLSTRAPRRRQRREGRHRLRPLVERDEHGEWRARVTLDV
jgi:SHS2 domain-containing protein